MFVRFVIPFLFLAVVIGGGYLLWNAIKNLRIRRRILGPLRELEAEYEAFIINREILADLQEQSLASAKSAIMADAIQVLRPRIDALLGRLESLPVHQLPQSIHSEIFPNVIPAYRSIWNGSSTAGISSDDRKVFREAVAEAVSADLSKRILQLQTGATL